MKLASKNSPLSRFKLDTVTMVTARTTKPSRRIYSDRPGTSLIYSFFCQYYLVVKGCWIAGFQFVGLMRAVGPMVIEIDTMSLHYSQRKLVPSIF